MNRVDRLQRSAICAFTAVVVFLLFTAPASGDFVNGRPFFLIVMASASVLAAIAGCVFLGVADRVTACEEQRERPAAATA